MPNTPTSYPIVETTDIQVRSDAPIIDGIETINRSTARIALVVDKDGRMVGSLVDGDVRRALLAGCKLDSPVREAMHNKPFSMPVGSNRQQLIEGMRLAQIKQMPLLDTDGKLLGIAVYDMLTGFKREARKNPVIIMAGGKGKRLLPLTRDIPKPMVEVGGVPMLEHIIKQLVKQGFHEIYISVNHLGHMIEEYFGNGSMWSCEITYLREKESLGTAGALSLIEKPFSHPFLMMNGDILASVDFLELLDFHITSGAAATLCARAHRMEVPFGVIELKDGFLQRIVEKPVYENLISAGIYVLNPEMLARVPKNSVTDMPTLLQAAVTDKKKVGVFPLREDWMDVGRIGDLLKAESYFGSGN